MAAALCKRRKTPHEAIRKSISHTAQLYKASSDQMHIIHESFFAEMALLLVEELNDLGMNLCVYLRASCYSMEVE